MWSMSKYIYMYVQYMFQNDGVHCCGTGGSMCACQAAGLGSIPGWDKFPGRGFFGAFPHL